jgi:hypothetical protein
VAAWPSGGIDVVLDRVGTGPAMENTIQAAPDLPLIRSYLAALPFLEETLRGAPQTRGVADAANQVMAREYQEHEDVHISLL